MESQVPLTLTVSAVEGGLSVAFGATSSPGIAGHTVALPPGKLEALGQAVLDAVVRTARRGRARSDAAQRLAAAGSALADAVLSPSFKAALAAATAGTALGLRLDGAAVIAVPWEAMVVGGGSLASRLDIGRQLVVVGREAPPRASAARAVPRVLVIADPAGDLPHARREGELLAGLLGASDSGCAVTLRAGSVGRDEVLAELRRCDALHFAGHADPADEAAEGWRLADGRLTAADVAELAGGAGCPALVVAHACRSARHGTDAALRSFVRAGTRHAVGTQWDVPDEAAPGAAIAFWRAVLAGATCGKATRAARAAAGEVGGTAYVLFGAPQDAALPELHACGACATPAAGDQSRFCDRCGAPLRVAARPDEERRRVTVASVGVEPHPDFDAEEVHRVLNECYAHISAVVRRYGGTVDRFAGDAVVAVFGTPEAHENDPERALLAAIEVVRGPGAGVSARAGVDTGVALVGGLGDEHRRDHGLAGAVLIEAGKLMRAAGPGQVLCGPETARAAQNAMRTRPVRGAQGALRVLGPRAAGERRARRGLGQPLPLVGRREELERLQSAFAAVRRERQPASVTVIGQAGIGKSRLVEAFIEKARGSPSPPEVAQCHALPYEAGDPYGPVAELLRELLDVPEGTSAALLMAALDRLGPAAPGASGVDTLPDWVPQPEPTPGTDAEDRKALATVLGLDPPGPADDAATRRHRVHAAVQRLVERRAAAGPLVLCMGDLHWAPDATLDLVEDLARFLEGVPVLLVCLARPLLLERRPHFGEGRPDHVRVDLGPLDDGACRDLVRAIAQRAGPVDDDAAAASIARSDGNPLFLEELVKNHLERDDASGSAVPDTLEGVLAARLDRCGDEERALLRRGAVLGRTFWRGAVEAMGAPGGGAAALQGLRARGILLRREPSRVADDEEFVFKHILLRDVAYSRIGRAERGALHRAAAAWLEGLPGDWLDARAEHYEQAGDALRASELREAAGERSAAARSDREAQVHYRAALSLVEQAAPGDQDRRQADLDERLADSLARTGGFDEALACYARVLQLDGLDPGREADLHRRQARVHDSRGAFDEALASLDRADVASQDHDLGPALAARLRADRGWVLHRREQLDEAEVCYRRALDLLGPEGPEPERALVHNLLGALYYTRSDLDRSVEHHERALALRQALGDAAGVGKSYNNLGIVAERRGDLDSAADWHARSVRLKAAAGDRPGLALAYNNLGVLYWRREDLDKAAAAFTASLELKRRLGNVWGEAITLANLAEVLLDSGDLVGCARRLAEAEARALAADNPSLVPEVRRLEAQLAWAQGNEAHAADKARAAVQAARDLGNQVREGAALRVLGEVTEDAEALLESVKLLDAAGDAAEADRARAALDALRACGDA